MNEERYQIWKADDKQWYWRFKAANNEIVAGGEGYKNKQDCLHAIGLLKASADCKIYNLTPDT